MVTVRPAAIANTGCFGRKWELDKVILIDITDRV